MHFNTGWMRVRYMCEDYFGRGPTDRDHRHRQQAVHRQVRSEGALIAITKEEVAANVGLVEFDSPEENRIDNDLRYRHRGIPGIVTAIKRTEMDPHHEARLISKYTDKGWSVQLYADERGKFYLFS